jgi:diamine N-acetyltransferase
MEPGDVGRVLALMQALAVFERYADRFAVTAEALSNRAFAPQPDFSVCVCEGRDRTIIGYAVTYWVRWTCTLRPTLVLKEVFVDPAHRGGGAGKCLFAGIREMARSGGAGRIEWLVLPDNQAAQRFYEREGGARDEGWQRWVLDCT